MPVLRIGDDLNKAIQSELQRESFTEYTPYTGSDCKVLIIPDGDSIATSVIENALREMTEYIEAPATPELQPTTLIGVYPGVIDLSSALHPDKMRPDQDLEKKPFALVVGMQSIGISTFRRKSQVRKLGAVNSAGFARGSRTVAGTFVITEFDRSPFFDVLVAPRLDVNIRDIGPVLPDQMRPFDIIMFFANELGNVSYRQLYGVEIVTDGTVYSVHDLYTENTFSYIARDVSPLVPLNAEGKPVMSKLNGVINFANRMMANSNIARLKAARSPFK
jgi:hypothetical protein